MTARQRAVWAWSPRARRLNREAAWFNSELRRLNAMPVYGGRVIELQSDSDRRIVCQPKEAIR